MAQPKLIGQVAQEQSTRVSGNALAAGGHHNVGSDRVTLQFGSSLLVGNCWLRNQQFPLPRGIFRVNASGT